MSTAKSMATLYLNGKRNGSTLTATSSNKLNGTTSTQRFKSSTSNLAQSSQLRQLTNSKTRLKSTSMTNLVADGQTTGEHNSNNNNNNNSNQQQQQQVSAGRMQRPVSRNALDSIHNGMNAKYAQVQSKVYLQNIKPSLSAAQQQAASKIPGSKTLATTSLQPDGLISISSNSTTTTGKAAAAATTKLKAPTGSSSKQAIANERSLLMAKLKVLEDELESQANERETLRQELEREKGEKGEQVQQLKLELQEKLAEHDRQNEEYHKKLLEAYELADQNRRAADSVLNESRQRDEESRKRIELLEGELNELKEFVSMKEEMMGKMYELREQLRQERERYEEQLKSLHQVFENEKISHEEEQMLRAKHSMLPFNQQHSTSNNSIKYTDENSNSLYFNRMKPALESSESINKQHLYNTKTTPTQAATAAANNSTGCPKCQSGSSQLHKSEQDIYGSKMSTRMQDTANRAWKASRKFASSVITGGVNLSACRQCTKRSSPAPSENRKQQQVQLQVAGQYGCGSSASSSAQQPLNGAISSLEQQNDDDEHTSVIKVGPMNLAEETATNQQQQQQQQLQQQQCSPAPQRIRLASSRQQQPTELQTMPDSEQQLNSLIRVDENNKLTIVTKFNDSEMGQNSGPEAMGASSSVSERSRCESSSSGRGTSSDAGSSASQNGDDLPEANLNNNKKIKLPLAGSNQSKQEETPTKGHRRRSSLFKAGKILGGSQVSLHKLKSLFQVTTTNGNSNGSKAAAATGKQQSYKGGDQGQQQQQQQVSLDHLEASRLRCMELNQAISVTSIGISKQQQQQPQIIPATQSGHYPHNNNNDNNNSNNESKDTEVKDAEHAQVVAVEPATSQQQQQQQVDKASPRDEIHNDDKDNQIGQGATTTAQATASSNANAATTTTTTCGNETMDKAEDGNFHRDEVEEVAVKCNVASASKCDSNDQLNHSSGQLEMEMEQQQPLKAQPTLRVA